MQDMLNKDFDKLILKYGFSKVKEFAKSVFNTSDLNADNTMIGDRMVAVTEIKTPTIGIEINGIPHKRNLDRKYEIIMDRPVVYAGTNHNMKTTNLVDKIQYKGLEITLMYMRGGVRPSYTESKYDFMRTIKFNIYIKGVLKLSPDSRVELEYVEDLKSNTVIGDVYKNAFEYAKSIIDGGYAG